MEKRGRDNIFSEMISIVGAWLTAMRRAVIGMQGGKKRGSANRVVPFPKALCLRCPLLFQRVFGFHFYVPAIISSRPDEGESHSL